MDGQEIEDIEITKTIEDMKEPEINIEIDNLTEVELFFIGIILFFLGSFAGIIVGFLIKASFSCG